MAESSKGEYRPVLTCSRGEYEKILQAHGVNTRKYWLVEVIENDCIVTRVRVYDDILPEPSGNPSGSGNISSCTPPLVTIQLQYPWAKIWPRYGSFICWRRFSLECCLWYYFKASDLFWPRIIPGWLSFSQTLPMAVTMKYPSIMALMQQA